MLLETRPSLRPLAEVLAELDTLVPSAPFLALGQTIFWDEPLKGGLRLVSDRPLVAGVHDTDYFAKLSGAKDRREPYRLMPHNDTTTKGLWSAAAEFSALFGSETVITKEKLLAYGARLDRVVRARPHALDEVTEAHGWRGLVSTREETPVSAEVPLDELRAPLRGALEWALNQTVQSVGEPERLLAQERAEAFLARFDAVAAQHSTLASFYRALLPDLYDLVVGEPVELTATTTTELLRFNRQTYARPRFDVLDMFLCPETRDLARQAYDEAVAGSEIYPLDRFMSGALPFEVYVPGHGRGTLRIAKHAVIIMTPKPLFISTKKRVESAAELAEAIERKFGPNCTLSGKAVTLVGMLAREFVFVFHEGASAYVKRSRRLFSKLPIRLNPILRIRYRTWEALSHCYTWLRLPDPIQRAFETEEICAPSFAARWPEVVADQRARLEAFRSIRRPIELIQYLREVGSPSWKCLSTEYQQLHDRLAALEGEIEIVKARRRAEYGRLRELKQARLAAERAKGDHFRAEVFEKDASSAALAERKRLSAEVDRLGEAVTASRRQIRELMAEQKAIASHPDVQRTHERRRAIELEAELKRVRLIRAALTATEGLENAAHRPSAWWFPVVCPDGGWYRETLRTAEAYLEPLT